MSRLLSAKRQFERGLRISKQIVRRERSLGSVLRAARDKVRASRARTPASRMQLWYEENSPSAADLRAQRARTWPEHAPRISLLLACPASPPKLVQATLASVQRQTYARWAVHLAVAPEQADAIRRLAMRAIGAGRVTMTANQPHRNAVDLQAALDAASGDFVAVVAAGDELAPQALYELADFLLENPDCDAVYCDEDCFDPCSKRRHGLRLKPGWSPEMLLGHNYIGRLCLVRRDALAACGGFNGELGEAQEYDAILRIAERTDRIRRVPRCLYHRRAESGAGESLSTWDGGPELRAQVVQQHLARRGYHATVAAEPDGSCRVAWPIDRGPLVSIVIPTQDNLDVLKVCLDGLFERTSYRNFEIILVDNGSTEPEVHRYYEHLVKTGQATVVPYDQDFNYSQACNLGAKFAKGELLLFLNNDTEVIGPDWLEEMVRLCLLPGVGVVGARLLYPTGDIQHAGVVLGVHVFAHFYYGKRPGRRDEFGSPEMYRNLLAVTGACQMMSRAVFDQVAGYDERYRLAFSDVMLCIRAWKTGYRNVYTPHAALYHREGCSRGKHIPIEDSETAAQDLHDLRLEEDPYFHPAFSPYHTDPTLRLKAEPDQRQVLAAIIAAYSSWRNPPATLDLFDDDAVRDVFDGRADRLAFPSGETSQIESSPWAAARFALHLLRTAPDLRRKFPRALSEGADGSYCRWLCTEAIDIYRLPPQSAARFREAFELRPGLAVRQIFDWREDVRREFPSALLPRGRRPFLAWLLNHGQQEYALCDEQIWWFLLETSEDPLRELVSTYLALPAWQSRFPAALTEPGWPAFYRWACQREGLLPGELADSAFVSPLPPLEQLHVLFNSHSRWRRRFPAAFHDRSELRRLLDWLKDLPAGEDLTIDAHWLARVETAMCDPAEPRFGLNIVGHFNYPSGLQVSVKSIAESARLLGVPTSLRDVPAEFAKTPLDRRPFMGLELYDATLIHVQPEPYFSTVYAQAGLEPAPGRYRIGMWYWEFGEIPPEWGVQAETLHEVWAPTRFIAEALHRSLRVPVHSVLPGVRLGAFTPLPRSHFGIPDDRYAFLFMFDMNSIQERKNPLGLIEAYVEAVRADDRAVLVIKVSRGANAPRELARLLQAAKRAHAIVIDRMMSREESYALMHACDCYVSLHRSEGLGLTMAEAMLLAKPVIATGYSGNLDFMTPRDSRLVGYRLVPLERDIHPYRRGWLWAEPSCEEAACWMRWACKHPDEARELGLLGQQAALRALSPEAAAARIDTRLAAIHQMRAGDQTNLRAA